LNRTRTILSALVAVLLLANGCHHSAKRSRITINPELANLTKEQIFERGEQQYAKRRFARARTYYQNVYENSPNDPLGRRSLLRIADTYFMQGDPVNLVEAQYKYRDFINRYPGTENGDYAMLQIAMVSYKQMERPDRDQQKTREAVDKFQDMLRAYPRSPLRPDAENKLKEVFDRLARHDQIVARYYMKRHSYDAAVRRLNYVIDTYPNYTERVSVFYDLGDSLEHLGRKGEARLYFERVVSEFPKSDLAEKARKKLSGAKA
jgi:outer membrane protein assembly factor BamD